MRNEDRLQTLEIVQLIKRHPDSISSKQLMGIFQISIRTLKRRLAMARELGVVFKSESRGIRGSSGGNYVWTITNADEIRQAGWLNQWVELEWRESLVVVTPDFYMEAEEVKAGLPWQVAIRIFQDDQAVFEGTAPFKDEQVESLVQILNGRVVACDMRSFDGYQARAALGKAKVECRFIHQGNPFTDSEGPFSDRAGDF